LDIVKENVDNDKKGKRKTCTRPLLNQGKTIREIAKEVRMSFRDIGVILNKAIGEKDKEGIKQQDDAEKDQEQQ
jgi:hypothetical protein